MKAITLEKYGSTDNLILNEVAKPKPLQGEVLVRIHSAAVNDWDWGMVLGSPFYMRLICGLFRPKIGIPGVDIAGVVEETGTQVTKFKAGDKVYADLSDSGFGGFAEYVAVGEEHLSPIPKGLTFNEAAALPHAAALTVQGLIDLGEVKPGQHVCINGAGGGVGTIGVQYLKWLGCEVTGVDSESKLEMMRGAGFDHVIDYRSEDFTRRKQKYDLVLDTKSNRSFYKYLRPLKPGGKNITVGGQIGKIMSIALLGGIVRLLTGKTLKVLGLKPNKGLEHIAELNSRQKLKLVLDGPFPLAETNKAVEHFGIAAHKGKVIVEIL